LGKLKRILFMLLCLCLLVCGTADMIPEVCAASAMAASEACIEFIKEVEGFSPQPYYDYSQHTVGYGTKCPDDKYFDYLANGIPREEAEVLLRETVADISDTINKKLVGQYGLTFTQHQFDALVSFSFNLGTSWMTYDSTLRNALLRDAGDDELVYAFSLYCTAGGSYSSGLVARRLYEANMYLNGIYSKTINDAYGYVFYDPNGGSLTYRVQGFICDNGSAPVADAVRSADVFLGWYTDVTGGSRVTELTRDLSCKTLFARWQSSENPENQDSSSTLIKVTGDVVNIRKGPGTGYGIAKQVYRNDVLILSHVSNISGRNWGKVQDGWICLEYTNYNDILNGTGDAEEEDYQQPSHTPAAPDTMPEVQAPQTGTDISPEEQESVWGIVRVNDLLRIRSGPGTAYSTVGYLFNGNEVEIFEQKAGGSMMWGRISRGWISMDYIVAADLPADGIPDPDTEYGQEPEQGHEPEEDPWEAPGDPDATSVEGTIIADALRIRSGPGTEYAIVGFYYENDTVVVFEQVLVDSVYWGKTETGWINLDYLVTDSTAEESTPSDDGKEMTVIADCLRVRKGIGTENRISALLYYGDKVTVLETETVDGTVWGRVYNGWICMDYVI